ncbi:MAG: immunoglobulin domain-containing protein [Candidatus Omnitrophica bacterium]|nr:immunoglobulin domain-containing protein [Candidatus Omnitrophota bacterium]
MSGGPGFIPGFLLQPADQSTPRGGSVTFRVAAAGDEPLHYQWRKDARDLTDDRRISGSASNTLTIANCLLADAGDYTVVVTNAVGSVESRPAKLTYVEIAPLAIRLVGGHV